MGQKFPASRLIEQLPDVLNSRFLEQCLCNTGRGRNAAHNVHDKDRIGLFSGQLQQAVVVSVFELEGRLGEGLS